MFDTARGRPARSAAADYRYRFPPSSRRIGNGLVVGEAADRLLYVHRLQRTAVRAIAGALIRIAPLELKIELAHHLYQHAEAAGALRRRLADLRVSEKVMDDEFPAWLELVANELLLVEDPVAFTLALGESLVRTIGAHLNRYVRATDPLLDQPTVRVLRPILTDLDEMRAWFDAVERAAIEAGDDPRSWREPAARLLVLLEALPLGGDCVCADARYERPHACARDDRLATFHHTRQYRSDDLPAGVVPVDEHAMQVLELLRVQRDELDAIETFANVIYDLQPPFELESLLARFVWDEARHAEMGQQNLERLGHDPFAIPCGIIGINVRSPLPPLMSFAQISFFGELNQVGTLRRMADRCYAAGDDATGRAFDYTHADEMMHLRAGRAWLQKLAKEAGTDLDGLERQALEQAVRRLREEDVIGEDYANSITGADLSALIGE